MTDLPSDDQERDGYLDIDPESFDDLETDSASDAPSGAERLDPPDEGEGGLNWRFVVGLLVAGAGIAYLVTDGIGSETYFFEVDEAVARSSSLVGERVRVKGTVVEGSIEGAEGTIGRDFTLSAKGETIRIQYDQAMPDTFKEESKVVATGELASRGTLEADKVLVKCPSRYEGKPPTAMPDKAKQSSR